MTGRIETYDEYGGGFGAERMGDDRIDVSLYARLGASALIQRPIPSGAAYIRVAGERSSPRSDGGCDLDGEGVECIDAGC